MMALLRKLLPFLNRRRSTSRFGAFGNRTSALAHRVGTKRGGLALGTLASIAAPFIINKIRSRRAQRAAAY